MPAAAGVLANDFDVDGQAITAVLVNNVAEWRLVAGRKWVVYLHAQCGLRRDGLVHVSCAPTGRSSRRCGRSR